MGLKLIVAGLAFLSATPAWATATLFCEASQKQIAFSLIGVVPDLQGSPLLQVRGEVAARPEGVRPVPAAIALSDANWTQYWFDGEVLDLVFYAESGTGGTFGSGELTIRTKVRADDDAYYDGSFHFEGYSGAVDKRVMLDGTVECSVG